MRNAQQPTGRRAAPNTVAARVPPARSRTRRSLAVFAATAVFAILATLTLVPAPRAITAPTAADGAGDSQTLAVAPGADAAQVSHESYVTTTGPATLVAGGTNEDWAKLVLVFGDWPLTTENVNAMLRWMRQENGTDNWWNRNNPLNNGYGSGGGSGLGSYDSLVSAAQYCADGLRKYAFYDAIEAGLEAGTSADATAQAIWASPWASSHYGNGTHWSTAPVPVVEAPASAW